MKLSRRDLTTAGLAPSCLWQERPAEGKGRWNYYEPVATTPDDKAFRPLDKGGCSLVKIWKVQ